MKIALLTLLLSLATSTTFAQAWTLTSAPITNWSCVASSADGSKLVAAASPGFIYTSMNSGRSWTQSTAPSNAWIRVASSADGTQLFAAAPMLDVSTLAYGDGLIYRSSNSGGTWQSIGPVQANWKGVACSADGSSLVAIAAGYPVSASTNSGSTWWFLEMGGEPVAFDLASICLSASGSTLAVVETWDGGAPSQVDIMPGLVWDPNGFAPVSLEFVYCSVALSADGRRIVTAGNNTGQHSSCGGILYASSNLGANAVTNCTPVTNWTSVASSADGSRLVAVARGGAIYSSVDSGASWEPTIATNANWTGVASSADGAKLVAVANGGGIYTWQSAPRPVLNMTATNDGLLGWWIIPSMSFRLQKNPDLATTNWTEVAIAPALSFTNLQNQVKLPVAGDHWFYRLQASAN